VLRTMVGSTCTHGVVRAGRVSLQPCPTQLAPAAAAAAAERVALSTAAAAVTPGVAEKAAGFCDTSRTCAAAASVSAVCVLTPSLLPLLAPVLDSSACMCL
jgi:hypothetical protein